MEQVVTSAAKSSGGSSAHVGWNLARLIPIVGVAVVSLAGCTAMLETERKQCTTHEDCVSAFGAEEPFLCVQNVCERPTCMQQSDCRKIEGIQFQKAVCDEESNRCVKPQCIVTTDCERGQACDPGTNTCVAAQCQTTEECQRNPATDTPTVACLGGLCIDEKWGCIGEPDERPRVASEQAVMRVPLLSSDNLRPVADAQWQVRVCRLPTLDPECTMPYALDKVEYDPATGIISMFGVPPGVAVRYMFDETSQKNAMGTASKYIPMDFFTQRPAVGDTLAKPVRVVNRDGLGALIASFATITAQSGRDPSKVVDPTKGNIFGNVLDCAGNSAGDVELSYQSVLGTDLTNADGTKAEITIFYFDEQATPSLDPQHSFTFNTGVFSSLGFPVKTPFLATTSLLWTGSNPVKKRVIRKGFQLFMPQYTLETSRMTTVHFYPRNYDPASSM